MEPKVLIIGGYTFCELVVQKLIKDGLHNYDIYTQVEYQNKLTTKVNCNFIFPYASTNSRAVKTISNYVRNKNITVVIFDQLNSAHQELIQSLSKSPSVAIVGLSSQTYKNLTVSGLKKYCLKTANIPFIEYSIYTGNTISFEQIIRRFKLPFMVRLEENKPQNYAKHIICRTNECWDTINSIYANNTIVVQEFYDTTAYEITVLCNKTAWQIKKPVQLSQELLIKIEKSLIKVLLLSFKVLNISFIGFMKIRVKIINNFPYIEDFYPIFSAKEIKDFFIELDSLTFLRNVVNNSTQQKYKAEDITFKLLPSAV